MAAPGVFAVLLNSFSDGSSKTQIALEYAYRRNSDMGCSVFWIHADNETTFTQDYRKIAKRLGLKGGLDGLELLMAVRSRIETIPSWLTVVDNANDLALFGALHTEHGNGEAHSLRDFVPQGQAGTVLWTSRDERISGSLVDAQQVIHVGPMTENETWALFRSGIHREIDVEAQDSMRLLAKLEGLPIGILQAAAYMRETCTPSSEYISKLNEQMNNPVMRRGTKFGPQDPVDRSQVFLQTCIISMEYIRQTNQMAYDILHILAFVDDKDISLELIASAAAILEKPSDEKVVTHVRASYEGQQGDQQNISDVISAVTLLRSFCLLQLHISENQYQAYELHKMVQDVARVSLKQPHRRSDETRYIRTAIHAVKSRFSKGEGNWCVSDETNLAHAWRVAQHVRFCSGEIEAALLLDRVSDYLRWRGRWREREGVVELACRFREEILGQGHPDTIRSKTELAEIYCGQKRYGAAENIYVDLLTMWRNIPGRTHPDMLQCMHSLTTLYYAQERYIEAQKMYVEVLELQCDDIGK